MSIETGGLESLALQRSAMSKNCPKFRVIVGKPRKNGNNRDICLCLHSGYDGRLRKLCEEIRIRRNI